MRIKCKRCGAGIELPVETHSGDVIRCGGCGKKIRIKLRPSRQRARAPEERASRERNPGQRAAVRHSAADPESRRRNAALSLFAVVVLAGVGMAIWRMGPLDGGAPQKPAQDLVASGDTRSENRNPDGGKLEDPNPDDIIPNVANAGAASAPAPETFGPETGRPADGSFQPQAAAASSPVAQGTTAPVAPAAPPVGQAGNPGSVSDSVPGGATILGSAPRPSGAPSSAPGIGSLPPARATGSPVAAGSPGSPAVPPTGLQPAPVVAEPLPPEAFFRRWSRANGEPLVYARFQAVTPSGDIRVQLFPRPWTLAGDESEEPLAFTGTFWAFLQEPGSPVLVRVGGVKLPDVPLNYVDYPRSAFCEEDQAYLAHLDELIPYAYVNKGRVRHYTLPWDEISFDDQQYVTDIIKYVQSLQQPVPQEPPLDGPVPDAPPPGNTGPNVGPFAPVPGEAPPGGPAPGAPAPGGSQPPLPVPSNAVPPSQPGGGPNVPPAGANPPVNAPAPFGSEAPPPQKPPGF